MRRLIMLFFFIITVVFPALSLLADVIITKDDMILNGKILEDKKPLYVLFANYHGDFTIKYKQIKEIHRTDSFEGDIKVLQQLGKPVNGDEVKNNYQSGEKKLREQNKAVTESSEESELFLLMVDVFTGKNYGELDSVLPSNRGVSISGEIPFDQRNVFKKIYIYGIDFEADYFYSEKEVRFIKGFSCAAGPLWRVPVGILGYHFNFNLSAAAGAGWYSVKNDSEEAEGIKWNMVFHAGPAFDFYSLVLSPQLRFDYIHDAVAPLYTIGVSIGAGYKF